MIYEHSKGSKFFLNEQKRDADLTVQVDKMLASLRGKLEQRHGNVSAEEREVDGTAERLELGRVQGQTVVVVDCDAFYASVVRTAATRARLTGAQEELEDPSLVGKAFGVGSGVLTTASYEARRYGCRSAMAGYVRVESGDQANRADRQSAVPACARATCRRELIRSDRVRQAQVRALLGGLAQGHGHSAPLRPDNVTGVAR